MVVGVMYKNLTELFTSDKNTRGTNKTRFVFQQQENQRRLFNQSIKTALKKNNKEKTKIYNILHVYGEDNDNIQTYLMVLNYGLSSKTKAQN